MEPTVFAMSPVVLSVIPLIVALVQVAKSLGLASKWAPVLSILLGVGLLALVADTLPVTIIGGILAGLSASGLYSGTKTVTE